MSVSWTALNSITPDSSFSEKSADCPIGTLDLTGAFQQSKYDWEYIYLLQRSRGGTCWGGQGFQEQHLILQLPISVRRKRRVKAVLRYRWASHKWSIEVKSSKLFFPPGPASLTPGFRVGFYLTLATLDGLSTTTNSLWGLRKLTEPRSLLSLRLSNQGGKQAIFMPSLFPPTNIYWLSTIL